MTGADSKNENRCDRPQYGVRVFGRTDEVTERFYAISAERKVKHPGVLAIADSARTELFG